MIKCFLIAALIFLGCSKKSDNKTDSPKVKKDKVVKLDSNSELSRYELDSQSPNKIDLSAELKEVSGITMTPDGRMFGHNDEKGIIFQIDPSNGNTIKSFKLGDPVVRDDFEDIAYVKDRFYLLKSSGDIYEFREGANGESVEYKIHTTDLNHANDVEGLAYDPETNSLLLACKGVSGIADSEDKAIYSFSLDDMKLNPVPRFMLPVNEIKKNFNPSGIAKNMKTGTFFVIAANGSEIIEISKDGAILGRHTLLPSVHEQPEGITFDSNNNLYISNEVKSGKGYIVIYKYKN